MTGQTGRAKEPRGTATSDPGATAYDRFIVRFGSEATPEDARRAVEASGTELGVRTWVERELATGALLARSERMLDMAAAGTWMAKLKAKGGVDYAEPDRSVSTVGEPGEPGEPDAPGGQGEPADGGDELPNDPAFPFQWHYQAPPEEPAGVNAVRAWPLARGEDVNVAIIDTGGTRHPDLDPNTVPGYDFISDPAISRDGDGRDGDPSDPGDYTLPGDCGDEQGRPSSWHGTHVGGTVAAVYDNGTAGVGIAHLSTIQQVRVLGRCGGVLSDVIDAIVWSAGGSVPGVADNPTPAKVLNLSLGGPGACTPSLQRAIDTAVGLGATVVVAAGNDSADARRVSPASCARVVTVAALDREGDRAFYSNFGPAIDISAPGGDLRRRPEDGVLSTLNSGETTPQEPVAGYLQGTSMSTPHAAAIAALVQSGRQEGELLTPAQVERALEANARPLPGSCPGGCGAGVADAFRTVLATRRQPPLSGEGTPGEGKPGEAELAAGK